MFFWLGLLITFMIIGGIIAVVNQPRQVGPGRPRLEMGPHDGLDDEGVEEFGELVCHVTANGLELLKDYAGVLEILERGDGFAPIEAKDALEKATVSANEILQACIQVAEASDDHPDDAVGFLEHCIGHAEYFTELYDDDGRLFSGDDNEKAIGVLSQATERVDNLLLAASDFTRRMLDFNLREWVGEELGADKKKMFVAALRRAEDAL